MTTHSRLTSGQGPRSILLAFTGLMIEGGIASVGRCIARVLDELVEGGRLLRVDRLLLLDGPHSSARPSPGGVLDRCGGSQQRFFLKLWMRILQRRPQFILFDHLGLARAVAWVPRPFRPPYGVFVHGGELAIATQPHRARALRQSDLILTNSAFTARNLISLFPNLASRVRVTLLCIDPDKVAVWEASSPPTETPRERAVVIVGRMAPQERGKGHDHLIEAWPAVLLRLPDARLWIVGGGADRPRLEEKAASLGLAGRVQFLGRVSDECLGDVYRRASLFAMPSRQEGFGLVYAEAMWQGLPCLGSTADAASEIIFSPEVGALVSYGDVAAIAAKVVEMLGDETLMEAMGQCARREARERFAYPRFRQDLLAALGLD